MRRLLKAIPFPFWCYFLPMTARTLGILPEAASFYQAMVYLLLPAALFLLLIATQFAPLLKTGRTAFATMLAGTSGIVLGGVLSCYLFRQFLPKEAWRGFGALAGSWTGGSINMASLKEAVGTPHELFSPMILVDSVIAYSWMAFLLFLVPYQNTFDRWVGAKQSLHQTLEETLNALSPKKGTAVLTFQRGGALLGTAAAGTALCFWLSRFLPVWEGVLTQQSWVVLLATTLAMLLALTPISRLESWGASRLGTLLLYLILLAMGAQADLKDLLRFPLFIVVGACWILIHGALLFCFGKCFRIPLVLLATASQANVGGIVSAPIVASCYKKHLGPLGLLLALFGNAVGTYLGFLTAHLIRLVL
ncbi:MAG: DUF819 family protein [Candidatus Omnitrophota bacterium]